MNRTPPHAGILTATAVDGAARAAAAGRAAGPSGPVGVEVLGDPVGVFFAARELEGQIRAVLAAGW